MEIERAVRDVRSIFAAALRRVEPRALVLEALQLDGDTLVVDDRRIPLAKGSRIIVVAIGKASIPMALGAEDALGELISRGVAATKRGALPADSAARPRRIEPLEAAHPVPDQSSVEAGRRVLELVHGLSPDDVVLVLISGGGSALVEQPVPGVELEDIAATTEMLMKAGAGIEVLNAARRRLSRIKAGGLARAIAPGKVVNLIVSDVLGNPLPVIASGPSVDPGPARLDAAEAAKRLGVWEQIPEAARRVLSRASNDEVDRPLTNVVASVVLADAAMAARAAAEGAEALGYQAEILATRFDGEAREFARFWSALARHQREARTSEAAARPVCLVGAGEMTVTVRGEGRGGRNTEMALAAALAIEGIEGVAIASLATDGDDGSSGAVGGVVVGASVQRAQERGVDPRRLLDENDSARFLDAASGLIVTGPTGTNVNDLYLALIS